MTRKERHIMFNLSALVTALTAVAFNFKMLALIASVLFIATVPRVIYECFRREEHATSVQIKNKDWQQCYNIALIHKAIGDKK